MILNCFIFVPWASTKTQTYTKSLLKAFISQTKKTSAWCSWAYIDASGTGSISKVGAEIPAQSARNFFLLCPPLFLGAPMPGHYRKVQGTVTRTELGQKWPTVRGQSDLWLFKVTLRQRWPCQKIEHRAWVVSYRSPVDTNSVSCSVSSILKHIFGQFRETSAHTLAAGSRAPEGIWSIGPPPNTWLLLPWMCTGNQLDRPSRSW